MCEPEKNEEKKEDLIRVENKKSDDNQKIKILGKEATKEKWKSATQETVEVWTNWVVRFTIWGFIALSVWTYYIDHDKILAMLYTIFAICVGISNKLYSLEKKIVK